MDEISKMNEDEFQEYLNNQWINKEFQADEDYRYWLIKKFLHNSIGLNKQYLTPRLIEEVDNEDNGALNSALRTTLNSLITHAQFSFVLYGPPGVGKTYNAMAMFWQFVNDTSLPVYFLGMQKAQELLTSSWSDYDLRDNVRQMKNFASQAPLLILDDLGAEVPSSQFNKPAPPHINKFLYEIAEERRVRNLPVIITSNLMRSDDYDRNQYEMMYDGRMTSRLLPKDDNFWINLSNFRDRRN